jgi:hypothetical protein
MPLEKLGGLLRTWPLLIGTAVFFIIVFLLNPAQFGIFFWGLLKLTAAGTGGYWVDRVVFYYARPGQNPKDPHEISWMYRRAIIIAGALLAMGANL